MTRQTPEKATARAVGTARAVRSIGDGASRQRLALNCVSVFFFTSPALNVLSRHSDEPSFFSCTVTGLTPSIVRATLAVLVDDNGAAADGFVPHTAEDAAVLWLEANPRSFSIPIMAASQGLLATRELDLTKLALRASGTQAGGR